METKLVRIAQIAKVKPKEVFTSLYHHLNEEMWSSPDKTDSQLSDHGHFFVFLRAIIPYRRM
jgi:hypothetical protein